MSGPESVPRVLLVFVLAGALLSLAAACGLGSDGGPADEGRALAQQRGCLSCHTSDGSSSVGPTWKGLYRSSVDLDDGTTVTAGDAYLRESILSPSAKTVNGFEKGRMETVIKPGSLSEEEIRALIAYIKSL